ncbi:Methyltransferase type 11 domain containing protein [Aphelenchoides bicaudatus]|nr:Methyltransferase type 11 domain containing protein [Aphelenchoides bicaudatus]
MATTVQRTDNDKVYGFWSKFSVDPSINSMMLNQNADQLEESDRMAILEALPDLTDMFVVDIGAGIGRFTTNFAPKAKHVLSVDFIESFIEQNKVRNSHFDNITFQTNDALGFEVESESVDLMFSNWLMMYLEDSDVIQFLFKTMKALKPNAFLHLRESCTESSTHAKKSNGTMHLGENPTHYRHASVYIQLLQKLRWRDERGQLWGFKIYFSNSVPTYIEAASNWRQVHWLAEKVPMQENSGIDNPTALALSMTRWTILQNHIEHTLFEKQSWTDKVLGEAIEKLQLFSANDTILTYSPRMISPFLYVNSNLILDKSAANVWSVELNPYAYCERLSIANSVANKRVRYSWNSNLNETLDYWRPKQAQFQGFVGTEMLISTDEDALQNLNGILAPGSDIIFIEPALSLEDFEAKSASVIGRHFDVISITDVSETYTIGVVRRMSTRTLVQSVLERHFQFVKGQITVSNQMLLERTIPIPIQFGCLFMHELVRNCKLSCDIRLNGSMEVPS